MVQDAVACAVAPAGVAGPRVAKQSQRRHAVQVGEVRRKRIAADERLGAVKERAEGGQVGVVRGGDFRQLGLAGAEHDGLIAGGA